MKSFREQFEVCAAEGMHGRGPVLNYAIHPGLIPHDPALGKFVVTIEDGLPTVGCVRFGGICSSGKAECKRLRNEVCHCPA